jgi:hypothetical protein
MKIIFGALFFVSVCVTAQRPVGVTDKELKDLVGNWAGTMVYTDAKNEKLQVTYQVALEIVDMKDSLIFHYTYTDPAGNQARDTSSLRIYDNGDKLSFDSAQFDIMATRRRGPRVTIIAERSGAENFRSADFQEAINFGPGILNFTKGIRYMDMSETYFIRKRVTLTKK